MLKRFFLKYGKVGLILFAIGLTMLVAIGFDMRLNEKEDFPPFTLAFSIIALIGLIFGVTSVVVLFMGKRRKNKKR